MLALLSRRVLVHLSDGLGRLLDRLTPQNQLLQVFFVLDTHDSMLDRWRQNTR